MMKFQKVDTRVLLSMVNAFSAYYGREYTPEELVDSKETISLIQKELESRRLENPGTLLGHIRLNGLNAV